MAKKKKKPPAKKKPAPVKKKPPAPAKPKVSKRAAAPKARPPITSPPRYRMVQGANETEGTAGELVEAFYPAGKPRDNFERKLVNLRPGGITEGDGWAAERID